MRATYVDNMCEASDTIFLIMKANSHPLAFLKKVLQPLHCHCIVFSIVECDMAKLNNISTRKRLGIHATELTFSVTFARSKRYRRALAILLPVCFTLTRWNAISADLSVRRPVVSS